MKFDRKLFRGFELRKKWDRMEGQSSTVYIKLKAHISTTKPLKFLKHGTGRALLAFQQRTIYNTILKNAPHPGILPGLGSPSSPSS